MPFAEPPDDQAPVRGDRIISGQHLAALSLESDLKIADSPDDLRRVDDLSGARGAGLKLLSAGPTRSQEKTQNSDAERFAEHSEYLSEVRVFATDAKAAVDIDIDCGSFISEA
jgi:hypothetical protein